MSEDIQENPSQDSSDLIRADELYRLVSFLSTDLCNLESGALRQARLTEEEEKEEEKALRELVAENILAYDERLAAIVLEEPTTYLARHNIPRIKEKIAKNDADEAAYREKNQVPPFEEVSKRMEESRQDLHEVVRKVAKTWAVLRDYEDQNPVLEKVADFNKERSRHKGLPITECTLLDSYAPPSGWRDLPKHFWRLLSDPAYRTVQRLLKKHKTDPASLIAVMAKRDGLEKGANEANQDECAARWCLHVDESNFYALKGFAFRRKELQAMLDPEGLLRLLQNSVVSLLGREGFTERLLAAWPEEARRTALGHATRREAFGRLQAHFKERADEASAFRQISLQGEGALGQFMEAGRAGMTFMVNRSLLTNALQQACDDREFFKVQGPMMQVAIRDYIQHSGDLAASGALPMDLYLVGDFGPSPRYIPANMKLNRPAVPAKEEARTALQKGVEAVSSIVMQAQNMPTAQGLRSDLRL